DAPLHCSPHTSSSYYHSRPHLYVHSFPTRRSSDLKLFGAPELAVGSAIRVRGAQLLVKGVIAKKGTVLGQSWDGFVMLPLTTFESLYGRRQTTVISVKMPTAAGVAGGMLRAEEAIRIAPRLRPG